LRDVDQARTGRDRNERHAVRTRGISVENASMNAGVWIKQLAFQTQPKIEELPDDETYLRRDEMTGKHSTYDFIQLFLVDSVHYFVD
jgi:hypothetical protein